LILGNTASEIAGTGPVKLAQNHRKKQKQPDKDYRNPSKKVARLGAENRTGAGAAKRRAQAAPPTLLNQNNKYQNNARQAEQHSYEMHYETDRQQWKTKHINSS
jgi:hypothetical protein